MTITEAQPIVNLVLKKDEAWQFVRAAKFAAQHASTDYARPIITTVQITMFHDELKVRFVGTDSYKLAMVETWFLEAAPPIDKDITVLIDAKQLLNILPTKSKLTSVVSIIIDDAGLTFQNETTNFLPAQEGQYPGVAGLMTPWHGRLEGTDIYAVNPTHMAKIMTCFKQIADRSEAPVKVIQQDRMRPIGFEMDQLDLMNVKSLLMPVRITS